MLDKNRAWAPLFASVVTITSALAISGCQGTIGSDGASQGGGSSAAGPPGTVATGATAASGATGNAGTTDPAQVAGQLNVAYTRLTQVEYQATIKAAYNVVAAVSGIPDDDRVGPFTANVSSPDPAQVFLLASEDLAAAIVPAQLPACAAATATSCVQTSYQPAIERLYRRALSAAEVTALTNIVTSLQTAGLSAQDATRSMVVSTLLSANFLFRSDPLSGTNARGARLAEHLGYALWDAPPDAALVAAGKVAAADLGASLKEQAVRLGSDARAVPVLARFMAQWLSVDVDTLLADPSASFATSPLYAELQGFVKSALTTNMTVKSFVNGTQGFIQKADFPAYGLPASTSTSDIVPTTWAANTVRRGILGEELFMNVTRHPDAGRRPIFRGHVVRTNLLCQPVPAPPPNVVCLDTTVMDRTTDTRCATCHSKMDPIGKAFAPLDLDNMIGSPAPVVNNGPADVTGTFASLPAMLDAIANSKEYADCFSQNLLGFLLEQSPDAVDPAAVGDVSAVVKSGGTLADAVGQAVVSLEKRSQSTTPWCAAQ